jgi:PKD domain
VVHPSRRSQIAAALGIGLALLCASAQAQVFSPPTNVSSNTDFSMTPQAAVDAGGNINVVWEDDTATNSNILFRRSSDGGATFPTFKPLSNTTGFSSSPRICVDRTGAINVVWVDDTPGNQVVYFSRSIDGGATFSPPVGLSSVAAYSSSPQISVDGAGNISVVWESDSAPVGILFRHSTDGGATFSPPVNLATNTTGSIAPQMAIGVDGSINVVWEDDFNFQSDISFARSSDQGATFSPPTNLSHNAGNSSEAQIAVDLSGNINVAWMDDTPSNFAILFTRSTDRGATFPSVTNVSNSTGDSSSPQIAVDASGNIFVVWQKNIPPALNQQIFFARSSDGGATFPTQNVSSDSGNSINPSMAVDTTGGINLVWQDNTPGRPNVFFARSVDAGVTFSSPPQNVSSDSGSSSDVQITADSNGNLNVVWSDNTPGVNQIFFRRFSDPPPTTNQPPVANAGPDQTLPATGPTTPVELNGSLSSDPDGDALTFVWTQGGTVVGNSAVVPLTLKIGTYTFTLTVTDAGGLSSSAVTHVTITARPPVANAGPDQTLPAAGPNGTPVTLNGSQSSDPNGYALTFVWTQGGAVVGRSAVLPLTLNVGAYTFTLTVTDTAGLSSSAVTHVTITARPPVASVVADPTLECAGPGGTLVKLDGSASIDPNGYPLKFVWTDDSSGKIVGNSAVVWVMVSVGPLPHYYTLTVTDATTGLSSSAKTGVTVRDTKPPTLKVSLSPNVLWPPNNKLVQITAQVQTSDVCDANPAIQLVSITSNGSDSNDIQAVGGGPIAFGTDVRSFLLRAVRSAGKDRVYTVTYSAKDASGNTTVVSVQVRVGNPHQYEKGPGRPRKSKGDHDRG